MRGHSGMGEKHVSRRCRDTRLKRSRAKDLCWISIFRFLDGVGYQEIPISMRDNIDKEGDVVFLYDPNGADFRFRRGLARVALLRRGALTRVSRVPRI